MAVPVKVFICFKKSQLVYSGISEETIRFTYTEYVDDQAHLSFQDRTSEITSHLYVPQEITFKDISLQILEATESYVTFRIVEDDDLSWIPK